MGRITRRDAEKILFASYAGLFLDRRDALASPTPSVNGDVNTAGETQAIAPGSNSPKGTAPAQPHTNPAGRTFFWRRRRILALVMHQLGSVRGVILGRGTGGPRMEWRRISSASTMGGWIRRNISNRECFGWK
jgi:hypothetical protein